MEKVRTDTGIGRFFAGGVVVLSTPLTARFNNMPYSSARSRMLHNTGKCRSKRHFFPTSVRGRVFSNTSWGDLQPRGFGQGALVIIEAREGAGAEQPRSGDMENIEGPVGNLR